MAYISAKFSVLQANAEHLDMQGKPSNSERDRLHSCRMNISHHFDGFLLQLIQRLVI